MGLSKNENLELFRNYQQLSTAINRNLFSLREKGASRWVRLFNYIAIPYLVTGIEKNFFYTTLSVIFDQCN